MPSYSAWSVRAIWVVWHHYSRSAGEVLLVGVASKKGFFRFKVRGLGFLSVLS